MMLQDNGTAGSAARERVTALFLHDPGLGTGYFTLTGDAAVEDH